MKLFCISRVSGFMALELKEYQYHERYSDGETSTGLNFSFFSPF